MAKKPAYKSVAVPTAIAITSRASVKVGESFYTVDYHEERAIPDEAVATVNMEKERELLWNTCNTEVDKQIEDILKTYKK